VKSPYCRRALDGPRLQRVTVESHIPETPARPPMTRRQAAGLFTIAATATALPACASPGEGDPADLRPASGRLGDQAQGGSRGHPTPTTVWSFQPRDPEKAPFRLEIAGRRFNGTFDAVMYLGYNTAGSGARAIDAEPAFRWCIEQDYDDGENRLVESYFEYSHRSYDRRAPPLGPSRRPIMWQFDRETGQNHQFELRGTTFTFSDWDTGRPFASWGKAGLALGGNLPMSQSLTLRAPQEHGSLLIMEHDGRAALAIATATDSASVAVGGQPTLFLFRHRMAIGVRDGRAGLTVQDAAGADAIVASQGDRQRGDLFAARDQSGSTTYWRVGSRGHMLVGSTVAPTDDELNPGEVAMWLDVRTAGSKVMFRAKDADGTITSASVALT
jgi:hypothetical protein